MVAKFSCKLCNKTGAKNHHAVQFGNCHLWVHIKCNNINLLTCKFLQKSSFTRPLYQENKILKITDFINNKNVLFVRNSLRKENLPIFNETFNMLNQNHAYNTRAATYNILDIPQVRTPDFEESSLKFKAQQTWNDLQINFNSDMLTYSYSIPDIRCEL